jgi:hypothetical protein
MTCKCGCECANLAVTNDDFKEFVRTNVKTLIANKVMFTARDVYNFTFFMGTHNHKFNDIKYTIIKIIEESILDTSYVISVINNPADETEMCSLLYRDIESDIAEYPLANLKSFFDIFDQMIKAEETSEDEEEVPEEEELLEENEDDEEEELPEEENDDEEEETSEEEEDEDLEEEELELDDDNWVLLNEDSVLTADGRGRLTIPKQFMDKINFEKSMDYNAYIEGYYIGDLEDKDAEDEPIIEISLDKDVIDWDNPEAKIVRSNADGSLRVSTRKTFGTVHQFSVFLDIVRETLIIRAAETEE